MTLRVEFDSWWEAQALWPMIHVFLKQGAREGSSERIGVKVRHQRLEARLLLRDPFVLCHFLIELMKPKRKYPIHSLPHFPLVSKVMQKKGKGYNSSNCQESAQWNREEMQNILVTLKVAVYSLWWEVRDDEKRPHWCQKCKGCKATEEGEGR